MKLLGTGSEESAAKTMLRCERVLDAYPGNRLSWIQVSRQDPGSITLES
jgi:hypothetical protein